MKYIPKTAKWRTVTGLSIAWIMFTVVYSIFYLSIPTGSSRSLEIVRFCFLSTSAFGVLFSALLTSFNSLEVSRVSEQRLVFDKIENSFEFIHRWDSVSLKEARDVTRQIKKEVQELSPKALNEKIKNTSSVERSVITMFNFFEEIYLSIISERVNEDILKKAYGQMYQDIYSRFEGWIASELGDDHRASLKKLKNIWE